MDNVGTVNELILHQILEQAGLSKYYNKFLEVGIDNPLDLLYASNIEFLAICGMVSMNAKPYHVIKLQNSVRDYFGVGDGFDDIGREEMDEESDEKNCKDLSIDVKEEYPVDKEEILLKTLTEMLNVKKS